MQCRGGQQPPRFKRLNRASRCDVSHWCPVPPHIDEGGGKCSGGIWQPQDKSPLIAAPRHGQLPIVSERAGQLLIATSPLKDPNFHRTVVLIVRDDENGTFGLVLNRPLE